MINKLKHIYPSVKEAKEVTQDQFDKYKWFSTNDNQIIGILHNELTEKDTKILSTFLTLYNHTAPPSTEKERIWYERIFKNSKLPANDPFRFVFFMIQEDHERHITFKEAINELFGRDIPILWNKSNSGIIIEEILSMEDLISYGQIIDIIIADLSIKVKFFVGDFYEEKESLQDYYNSIIKNGEHILTFSKRKVINYIESIPYLLLNEIDITYKEKIAKSILKTFYDDKEMLHTIEMYLNNNLNVSETAKHMYLHRNSLQYRINKFINDTGIAIQKFDEAITVKLALLIKKELE